MKFKQYLEEEYYGSFKSKINRKPYEVFENPSGKEIMTTGNIDGSVRWVANVEVKKVYIWPGNAELHEDVIPQIEPKIKFGSCILGSGLPRAGKIEITQNDRFVIVPRNINLNEWEFADWYFYGGLKNIIKKRAGTAKINEWK